MGSHGFVLEFSPISPNMQVGDEIARCSNVVKDICEKAEKSLASRINVNAYDVALSFAGENRVYVERVATLLRDRGVKVFYDKFEEVNLWGKNLAEHLAEVYATSRFVVMFVSKYYASKAWPTHERKHAQARALKDQKDIILPARFDDTEIPGLPDTIAYLNLCTISADELAERILMKLKVLS